MARVGRGDVITSGVRFGKGFLILYAKSDPGDGTGRLAEVTSGFTRI